MGGSSDVAEPIISVVAKIKSPFITYLLEIAEQRNVALITTFTRDFNNQ